MSPITSSEVTTGPIEAAFAAARNADRTALIPFVPCGHPAGVEPGEVLAMLAERGADVIELGIPFSDPLADGPVIQRASFEAIRRGVTAETVLETVRDFRASASTPIVLFTYLNPVLRYGVEDFLEAAIEAGADGILLTDLPPGVDSDLDRRLRASRLAWIPLVAPTTPESRLPQLVSGAEGFVYAIARRGVTGARTRFSDEIEAIIGRIRAHASAPIALGFGVSTPEDVRRMGRLADGVVVGSALVRRLEDGLPSGDAFFAELAHATRPS